MDVTSSKIQMDFPGRPRPGKRSASIGRRLYIYLAPYSNSTPYSSNGCTSFSRLKKIFRFKKFSGKRSASIGRRLLILIEKLVSWSQFSRCTKRVAMTTVSWTPPSCTPSSSNPCCPSTSSEVCGTCPTRKCRENWTGSSCTRYWASFPWSRLAMVEFFFKIFPSIF